MVQYHKYTRTKASGTGGLRRTNRDKRKAHWGGFFSRSKLAETEEVNSFRSRGGKRKAAVHKALFANVAKAGKVKKVKILNVIESPDNRHYARENLISKGALIETELGKARVRSRPGQNGVVNAVLLDDAKPKA